MIILFFLFIFSIIFIIILAIHTSKIGVQIENLKFNTETPKKINKECKIYLYLLLFNKIKLFKKNINVKKDINIIYQKNKEIKINYLELIKNINIDVKKLNLNAEIGTEDAALTALIVGTISGILGIVIKRHKYLITPIYKNKNFLKIELDGIFNVYLMHYIYIFIKKLIKQRRLLWENIQ